MQKNIKDYLHLYLGCEMYVFPIDTVESGWLKENIEKMPGLNYKYTLTLGNIIKTKIDGYLPILRPLSDMNEEECFELGEILNVHIPDHIIEALKNNSKYVIDFRYSFEFTRYLLSKHFDLFGLLDAGLAIDKTKIKLSNE